MHLSLFIPDLALAIIKVKYEEKKKKKGTTEYKYHLCTLYQAATILVAISVTLLSLTRPEDTAFVKLVPK